MLALVAVGSAACQPPPPKPLVTVSISWDDGRASQIDTLPIQAKYGLPATYYINSAMIGSSSYYMNKTQLDTVAAVPGNEIGGHTERHENLTSISLSAAQSTVCNDRNRLVGWYGEAAGKSFAYPYGAWNSEVEDVVAGCGYTSARTIGDVGDPATCSWCVAAETIPPQDPYNLRSPDSVENTTTLQDLVKRITVAWDHGGGWVVYTFHTLGSGTDQYSVSPEVYDQLLSFLKSAGNVQVRTVGDVMTNGLPPAT